MAPPAPLDLFACFDRARVTVDLEGARARLTTGHGLFSADRLDDGTRLLLDHLPPSAAGRVLDVGCGYGALGVPIALARPSSHVLCVDRDAVAARYAARNARELGLTNLHAIASLGYDAIAPDAGPFDVVLCNVPARIGRIGLMHLIEGGARRLAPGGEVRIVVIRDLAPAVEAIAAARGHDVAPIAAGPRHAVYRIGPDVPPASEDALLYARDEVEVGGLALARPHDASEDPGHAKDGAPLLAELLPRSAADAVVWRSPHGAMAVLLAQRGARVIAGDRDLLALAFAERNAARHGAAIEARAAAWLPELADLRAPLVVAELSSTAGERVARAELAAAARMLAPRGIALVLAPARVAHGALAADLGAHRASALAARGGWQVLRVAA